MTKAVPLQRVERDGAALLSSSPADGHHLVHFYEDEGVLFDVVARFLGAGLDAGDRLVVIATPEHREAFVRALHARPVERAITEGQLVLVDARETLARFMVGGRPDRARFLAVLDEVLTRATRGPARGSRPRLRRDGRPPVAGRRPRRGARARRALERGRGARTPFFVSCAPMSWPTSTRAATARASPTCAGRTATSCRTRVRPSTEPCRRWPRGGEAAAPARTACARSSSRARAVSPRSRRPCASRVRAAIRRKRAASRLRGALPPPGRCRHRLRDLHARSHGPRRDVEPGREADQGLRRRGDPRSALLGLLHPRGSRSREARSHPRDAASGGPLRGRGLARAQGRIALLGQRRHHSAARRRGRRRRLREGDPRSHAPAPGRGARAESSQRSPARAQRRGGGARSPPEAPPAGPGDRQPLARSGSRPRVRAPEHHEEPVRAGRPGQAPPRRHHRVPRPTVLRAAAQAVCDTRGAALPSSGTRP